MKYYGTKSYKVAHFPFNFIFTHPSNFASPKKLDESIKKWLHKMPTHGVANWQVENHDICRMTSKLHAEIGDIMLIVVMMLPGVACIYYGQEIGLMNTNLRSDQILDVSDRDRGRTPMQWDDSINAGFSSNLKPWLPVNPNYWQLNVQVQKKRPNSRYNLYKDMSKLRQTATLKYGNFTSHLVSSWVYAFERSTSTSKDNSVIVVTNMGSETEMVHLHTSIPNLPAYLLDSAYCHFEFWLRFWHKNLHKSQISKLFRHETVFSCCVVCIKYSHCSQSLALKFMNSDETF